MERDKQHFKSYQSKPMSFLNPHQGHSRTTTQKFFNQVNDIIDCHRSKLYLSKTTSPAKNNEAKRPIIP
ncbi:MAG: hypothetical protein OXE77_03675 [Flavobacteriaceae bacterium]|nr:hypothetical protein [Flavobacteriaceae bacterium]